MSSDPKDSQKPKSQARLAQDLVLDQRGTDPEMMPSSPLNVRPYTPPPGRAHSSPGLPPAIVPIPLGSTPRPSPRPAVSSSPPPPPRLPPPIASPSRANEAAPDDRERYEPPTQPIDLGGHHEMPLPQVVPPGGAYTPSPLPISSPLARTSPAPSSTRAAETLRAPETLHPPMRLPEPSRTPEAFRFPDVPSPRTASDPAMKREPAPLSIALPASILIVDDDAKAGAQVAARLLELGYSCRVVRMDAAERAIGGETYDAIVVEIPPEEARRDQGRDRIRRLGELDCPVIITSAAVVRLDALRSMPRVTSVLTKPYFVEVLAQSIEAGRSGGTGDVEQAPAGEASASAGPQAGSAGTAQPSNEPPRKTRERRVGERFDLDNNVVRAVISGGLEGGPARGRLRNVSMNGGFLIDTTARLERGTAVTLEMSLADGRTMLFSGRVARTGRQEMAVKATVDEKQKQFLEDFLDDALSREQKAIPPIRILLREEATGDLLGDVSLMKAWHEVSDRLDDDEVQQRFIQDCLKAEKLQFAIARYRELKAASPDDERVNKYLQQIGTILSFYALSKKDDVKEEAKMPASLKLVIGLFVAAAVGLLFLMRHFIR